MARLGLILIFMLQFEGISGTIIFQYYRPGHDATLPCATISSTETTCSSVTWLYNKNVSQTSTEVENGNVMKSSARAARLSVDTGCSLVINKVTAEDVGFYTCQQGRSTSQDVDIFLSVLSVSPSPPDADPKRDGEVTLECSLSRYSNLGPCPQNSVRWVNETGAALLGEGVGYKFLRQTECVSALTVKRQSGNNRKYTCQFVDNNKIEIEADYTPDFTESTGWSPLSYVMLVLRIAGLILMIVITIHVIRIKWNTKPLDDDDSENNDGDVQYENDGARPAAARLH
ncbi:uncharacterized protein LOC125896693 isoform X27 [Epinephelus fuscoguttatus]|uniref:uncharacterized protein LOC125896693 isoform X18 n=1 Tax=Epinephelus fuscoguttatus TaxID=293821 RepID=UPI0020D100E1|nr:uncharacterized protein LOC125896693 isoform X18 [Epinephelus fuscoguttatus]XP_049445446.1 uncharacterized protein LOC125896693 isoform X19 [Epinephelus fuscoguttatus]XP_049445447.1 uncharacterized protein LOC125896693 isoform X20 [Epinephelus fuscoguttatus]XP_049445448.1 uncharacterized protein LOC125896693 isoform X21 [Epinephelus fuscoguttatus]XP_049445449.1 uncharacterized protein LOC125896693 isoform X22 [Epinephelus fuscoguttatus]XP_049445450.1 uncharacterized protein LOC125896693 iso